MMEDYRIVQKIESLIKKSNCSEQNKAEMQEFIDRMSVMIGLGRKN
jgi:hypothetical protein